MATEARSIPELFRDQILASLGVTSAIRGIIESTKVLVKNDKLTLDQCLDINQGMLVEISQLSRTLRAPQETMRNNEMRQAITDPSGIDARIAGILLPYRRVHALLDSLIVDLDDTLPNTDEMNNAYTESIKLLTVMQTEWEKLYNDMMAEQPKHNGGYRKRKQRTQRKQRKQKHCKTHRNRK